MYGVHRTGPDTTAVLRGPSQVTTKQVHNFGGCLKRAIRKRFKLQFLI